MQVVAEREEAKWAEAERLEAERLEAERLEAERLEAERIEAERLEAARAEATRKEADSASSSNSRIDSMEKALEIVQEEKAIIKQKLEQHDASHADMKNMLAAILAKISGPSPSQS